ncbi:hypothetical protein [Oceaniglobus indicus]|uniref:hypothetical protein n=1 Tax=Oceaniglobus indicus TaxID=2047749 RepID=UPI000C176654|nr:hypothetical protein [Oceaniglobus indicus]
MPRFDPAEFGRMLACPSPHELRQAEGLVAEARERAEAVLEIDACAEKGAPAASCPRCGCGARVRSGRTRTSAQLWRCSGCLAMRNVVMTDKDAREQASRHFFTRAQRQAREG